jgi:hypothetical protein
MRDAPDRSCGSSGRLLAPVVALLGLVAVPVHAQEWIAAPPSRPETLAAPTPGQVATSSAGPATSAPGGVLRVLDKINGTVTDLEMQSGEAQDVGNLSIVMGDCRYPTDNPAGDAFILLSIRTKSDDSAIFEGWMIASAPALSAVDHPRFDVWALRCTGT